MTDEQHTSVEMRMVAARHAGRKVAANRGRRDNPWRWDAETAQERVLAIMWQRGYSEGNPVVLDEADGG